MNQATISAFFGVEYSKPYVTERLAHSCLDIVEEGHIELYVIMRTYVAMAARKVVPFQRPDRLDHVAVAEIAFAPPKAQNGG